VEGELPVRRQVRGLGENAKEKADGGLIGREGGNGLEEGAVVQVGQDPGGGREVRSTQGQRGVLLPSRSFYPPINFSSLPPSLPLFPPPFAVTFPSLAIVYPLQAINPNPNPNPNPFLPSTFSYVDPPSLYFFDLDRLSLVEEPMPTSPRPLPPPPSYPPSRPPSLSPSLPLTTEPDSRQENERQ
jgi:hypothetical protein